jgi:hypothetical protein
MDITFVKMVAEEVEAALVPFDEMGWVSIEIPQGQFLKRVYVAEALFQVDRIINLPVIKTHGSSTYSIALKNFVGATHFRQRPYLVDRTHWEEVIAELNLAYTPDLNIVDGTMVMVEGGPWKGRAVDANLIIATGDRIVADVVGLGVLKHYSPLPQIKGVDVWEQRQVKRAIELGLGVKREDEIELLERDLEPNIPGFKGVIETVRKVTRKKIIPIGAPRRPGDPARLVASSEKIRRELGWKPRYPDLETIVETAWQWHRNHPDGYGDKSIAHSV